MSGLIYLIAARHRRELLRRERAAASEMVRAYGLAWERIRSEIDQLTRAYYEALNAGEAVSESWMFRQGRLMQLRAQIEQELARIAMDATPAIRAQQLAAVQSAGQHAREMVAAASPATVVPSFTMLPTEAMTDLVGFLRNGSPLRILLDELGPLASQGVQDALIQGVALGYNPRKVARLARQSLGGNLARALRISRTEMMRSYREATHRNYQANNDVLDGWMWMAARDRACLMCLAMDGTIHRLSERLDDHPNGRCTPVPKLRGEPLPEYETGKQWFEKLDPTAKRELLGAAGFDAYQSGTIKLEDFIGRRRSREWGTTRYAKSLRDILPNGAGKVSKPAAVGRITFDSPDAARQWAEKSFSGWRNNLSPDEKDAIGLYVGGPGSNNYKQWNKSLRTTGVPPKNLQDATQSLDSALSKSVIDRDIVVYRGGHIHELDDNFDNLGGLIFQDNGYVSTALNKDDAYEFIRSYSGTPQSLMELRIPRGTHGAFINAKESEILLARGYRFRVLETFINEDDVRTAIVEVVL